MAIVDLIAVRYKIYPKNNRTELTHYTILYIPAVYFFCIVIATPLINYYYSYYYCGVCCMKYCVVILTV